MLCLVCSGIIEPSSLVTSADTIESSAILDMAPIISELPDEV